MNFFDLVNISEKEMKILNPMFKEKFEQLGNNMGLNEQKAVLDLACGFGEILAIWGTKFGVTGTGVEIREYACEKARKRLEELNLNNLAIECQNASNYTTKSKYDIVSVIGASFIYNGFQNSIKNMKAMMKEDGKLVIGEPYLIKEPMNQDVKQFIEDEGVLNEFELLEIIRNEGFELEYMVRSSQDEWDYYESQNWIGLNKWLVENPCHPDWDTVKNHLRESQDNYFKYGREYIGWAVYVLREQ
ncbi:SAM-dependent methyltransferase [Haloplasma contractile]|uniref:Methyltransferase type 11 protein n=1 Tax=Haloplasma contractile SSD-17B TaxID=1033810 RepID=U2E9Z7_9MOLU|nr:class I SAM-dependent methyltransferase [Haloplasma contractile]ERJ11948.1 Methyltransferase type 11 protein [Haloplasma contractile SSD-17B]